jgi:hypothetical protein
LQQIEETSEEAEYPRPCAELQQMLTDLREELVGFQPENSELHSRFDYDYGVKDKYTSFGRRKPNRCNSINSVIIHAIP